MDPSAKTMELRGTKTERKKRLLRGAWHLPKSDKPLQAHVLRRICNLVQILNYVFLSKQGLDRMYNTHQQLLKGPQGHSIPKGLELLFLEDPFHSFTVGYYY